ncbi:MAG: GGDEF domain-containing response regulator [Pseudomonadota bacterium]
MLNKFGKLKVLLVEDSKVAIKAISGYLDDLGVQLLIAETGSAAIDLYRRERPDIILLDIILPDITGYEVAKQVRKLQGKDDWTAIIFLSVMSKDDDLKRGIEAGGDDYLTKPVGKVVLQAKVAAMYRLVRMQRALVQLTEQLNQANEQLNLANQELHRVSMTDGLTGIPNRRVFDELLAREWRRCARLRKPLSVVMLDVDYFKKFNDRYGHQAGDQCLKSAAKVIAGAVPRASDLAARYGGEEFVLILGETDAEGARAVANRIREQVAGLKVANEDSPHRYVTLSCGISTVVPSDDKPSEKLVKSADNALYLAKKQGRNSVAYLDYGQGD